MSFETVDKKLQWSDPAPSRITRFNLSPLRARPGKWARIAVYTLREAAASRAFLFNKEKDIEAVSRTFLDGGVKKFGVWARCIEVPKKKRVKK